MSGFYHLATKKAPLGAFFDIGKNSFQSESGRKSGVVLQAPQSLGCLYYSLAIKSKKILAGCRTFSLSLKF